MSKINIFMRSAKWIFVLAAVVITSVALSSCSKDDDNKDEEKPAVVVDGKGYKVEEAYFHNYIKNDSDNITLFLKLAKEGNNKIMIRGCAQKYNGKRVYLSVKETSFGYTVSNWQMRCDNLDGGDGYYFYANALDEDVDGYKFTRFTTGTMQVDFNPEERMFSVVVQNATITDNIWGDKNPHEIEINWKGEAELQYD